MLYCADSSFDVVRNKRFFEISDKMLFMPHFVALR